MKQEKLCEVEDMTGPTWQEELGADNAEVRRQLRDAEILSSFPIGLKPRVKSEAVMPSDWKDVPAKAANARQVAGDHYKRMDVQPWDVVDYGPREQAIGFYRYNALKYVMRAGEKGEFKEDIAKAHHYLQKLLEILE